MHKSSVWYRQPMVWMVIAIPLSAIIMGAVMMTLAVSTYDGLVADDYYKKGLQINRSMERETLARKFDLAADALLGGDGEVIEVVLAGNAQFRAPELLNLRLFHTTRPGLDRHVALRRVASGAYLASGMRLESGSWYLQLDADGWRLATRLSAAQAAQRVHLGASRSPGQK